MTTPTTDTQTPSSQGIGPSLTANSATPCPHCGSTLRHTDRIGCCSACKILFSSLTAFDKHLRHGRHLTPHDAGLVARVDDRDPNVPVWGLPSPKGFSWRD